MLQVADDLLAEAAAAPARMDADADVERIAAKARRRAGAAADRRPIQFVEGDLAGCEVARNLFVRVLEEPGRELG